MKPGWQTTEFWITLISQVLALLAITGAISVGDREQLETALTNAITALFTLIASAMVVIGYIRSRTALKSITPPTGPQRTAPVLIAVLAGGLLLAAPAAAAPPVHPSCFFNCRRGTDPAVLAALQQLAQNQQTIIQLLQQRQASPPPPPSIIVLSPQGPRQEIPLGGAPRHDIPLGGAPRQDVPLGQPPRQEVPIGQPPKQDIPLGPMPQLIDAAPAPGKADAGLLHWQRLGPPLPRR